VMCFHSSTGRQFLRSSNFEMNFNFNLFATEPQVFSLLKCVNYLTWWLLHASFICFSWGLLSRLSSVIRHRSKLLSFVPINQPIPVLQNYPGEFDVCTVLLVQFIIQTNKYATYIHIYIYIYTHTHTYIYVCVCVYIYI